MAICKHCEHEKVIETSLGISGINLPSKCENNVSRNKKEKCPDNPYVVSEERSHFIDF